MSPEMATYGGVWVMVVEYLESSMSKDLLCKFPDNSAFDFDYSQSSIWSPLINRHLTSTPSNPISKNVLSCGLSRKLVYNEEEGVTQIKNATAKIKRKFTDVIFDNLLKYQKMKKRKWRNSFDPAPSSNKVPSASPTPKKGWGKMLKAASKHFKKSSKKDSFPKINFSSYF